MRLPLLSTLVLGAVLLNAVGCAGAPERSDADASRASRAGDIASSMLGKPYRYGGNHPTRGFDCSGLVYYSYRHAGVSVPRSTTGQRRAARKIAQSELTRGDLLFFDQEGKRSSHVGIYLGNNRFVHAPSSGKRVRIDSFQDPYWQRHLVDARRF